MRSLAASWLVTAVLTYSMAVSTVASVAIGVVAVDVIAELDISTAAIGALVAANTLGGALLSPVAGHVADRIGSRTALLAVFSTSAGGLALVGAAPTILIMVGGMLLGAVALALTNPATNRVIADLLDVGSRGLVTGVKQSGVQVAALASGLLLPLGMATVGWRASLVMAAALVAIAIPVTFVTIPGGGGVAASGDHPRIALSPTVLLLGGYAFLMGFANAGPVFIPLFAHEELAVGAQLAGLALAIVGLTSIVGRVVWARVAERHGDYRFFLLLFAATGAVAYGVVLLSADIGGWWLLAVGALGIGASSSSWNSVVTLAVFRTSPDRPGASSGTVMLGFFLGLGVASPAYGAAVDATGTFAPIWLGAVTALTGAWFLAHAWAEPRAAAA